ncbi:MAG: hypothetical protein LBH54_03415, partial [Clostridiales bacterium]|nr:hypothetical protein [Clostridiales bacterium]
MLKMLKTLCCFVLVIQICAASVTPAAAQSKNYMTNSGFEEVYFITDRFTGPRPSGWDFLSNWGTSGYSIGIDSAQARTGKSSLRLAGDNPEVRIAAAQTVRGLDPDKYYRISAYIKCENYTPSKISPSGPVIRVNCLGTSSYFLTDTIVKGGSSNTIDWTYAENIFTPGQTDIRVDCIFDNGTG